MPSASRLGLVGNPGNRRVREFQAITGAPCLPWAELLRDPASLDRFDVDRLRIDSPGEDEEVARGLIALGGGPPDAVREFGEIAWQEEYHRGFLALLERIARRGLPCLNPPADIAAMFDKWESHRRFAARGLPRPPTRLAPRDPEEFLAGMGPEGRVFLKPRFGSSASGMLALRWSRGRLQLAAPLSRRGGRLFNSLRVGTWTERAEIEALVRLLLPTGMVQERWIPKLTLEGGAVDLRVLVVAGEARHRVVRMSRTPMTNLHLGNRRGREEDLEPGVLRAACRLAEEAAALFPGSLSAGVDILLDARGRPHVGEINAFGDLLPGLVHRGESAYEAVAASCAV